MMGCMCVQSVIILGNLAHFIGLYHNVRPGAIFLIYLCRVTKCCKRQKRTIRKWRVDRFSDEGARAKYREALKAEVESFSESIRRN